MDDLDITQMEEVRISQGYTEGNGNGKTFNSGVQPQTEQATPAEIDRIRDIIFGSQHREIDRRFKLIERKAENLASSIQELTTRQERDKIELDNRLSMLEERLGQQIQALEASLQITRRETNERLSAIERQFADRLGVLERQLTDRLAHLEEYLSEQNDALSAGKVDRFDLGDLLIEAGMRVRQNKSAPVGQG